jgi:hypothetical protein
MMPAASPPLIGLIEKDAAFVCIGTTKTTNATHKIGISHRKRCAASIGMHWSVLVVVRTRSSVTHPKPSCHTRLSAGLTSEVIVFASRATSEVATALRGKMRFVDMLLLLGH